MTSQDQVYSQKVHIEEECEASLRKQRKEDEGTPLLRWLQQYGLMTGSYKEPGASAVDGDRLNTAQAAVSKKHA